MLPSLNLRFDLDKDLVGRFSASRTLARPDYSALGGSLTTDDTTRTGNGGNPELEPIISNNFDATLEWYFGPRALLAGSIYYMDLDNYVGFGTYQTELLNIRTGQFETFTISAPANSKGKVKGFELSWQQPFGLRLRRDGELHLRQRRGEGRPRPRGHLEEHVQRDRVLREQQVRGAPRVQLPLARTSSASTAARRSTRTTPRRSSANLSYYFNDNITFTFDAMNLNDPVLKMYGANKDQPRAFYQNGRQYYVGVRMKM